MSSADSPETPASGTLAELLIDCEEDRTLRPVLVGMLREGSRFAVLASFASSATRGADGHASRAGEGG
jgi:hypothetical protein